MSSRNIRVKQAFVDLPEGQIHYRTAGEGPNLVLLHLTASSSDGFLDIIPILATKYKVIAMDRLGHGGSDDPPGQFGNRLPGQHLHPLYGCPQA